MAVPRPSTQRLRDLDLTGWVFVAASGGAFLLALAEARALARGESTLASVLLFGLFGTACLWFADQIGAPELDARCTQCAAPVAVNSGRASHDVGVTVTFAGPPDRVGAGAVSAVTSRDRLTRTYCSAECARADLGPLKQASEQAATTTAASVPVPARHRTHAEPDAEAEEVA